MKVCLIDDDRDFRDAFLDLLERSGYEARGASNGLKAVPLLREWQPDVVVCDMLMPDSEGFEVLRIVRAEAPDTGFIMMSGASGGFLDLLKRAPHLGADAVLEKPFDPSDLLELIGGIRDRKKTEGDAVADPDSKDRFTRGAANHE